ncbi:glycosyltransferase family 4 protein [Candidatus Viridilinea mediisalina]|uniref:Glycosyl transferase family 1 n=1 Tax=Candidatus Viridilinea mediisalina TaxID=2024553 RepID=A0A2A6RN96_9CHLR|nr:glycosyltransferase family 4 protein [Candidatus Viridilinea mediisalina]PDW04396.1 glycosyl transferase family 1 [Candidatus Viridilinea mediisalina]
MNILLAIHHFPPSYSAGAELYTYRLALWLVAHGHTVQVVCIETLADDQAAGVRAEYEVYQGIPVWRLHLGLRGAHPEWPYKNPMVAAWLAEHLCSERPDLLHLHSGYLIGAGVLEVAHAHALPSMVTLHDYWFLCPRITLLRGDDEVCHAIPENPAGCAWCLRLEQRRHRLPDRWSHGAAGWAWMALASRPEAGQQAARRAYVQQTLRLAQMAIAPSRFLAGRFAGLIDPERLRVVRLGMDAQGLSNAAPPFTSPTLRLAYIGQIAPHKGVHVLIEALQRLPQSGRPLSLALHGGLTSFPAYVRQLKAQIRNDPRITLAGPFSSDQAATVLGAADVVVVPSIWYENSPLVILEAHASGRPVITSALGGMAELVHNEVDGLHFRPGDAGDLARQIERLRNDPALLNHLQAGIRPAVSVDQEMRQLMGLYEQVVQRGFDRLSQRRGG